MYFRNIIYFVNSRTNSDDNDAYYETEVYESIARDIEILILPIERNNATLFSTFQEDENYFSTKMEAQLSAASFALYDSNS